MLFGAPTSGDFSQILNFERPSLDLAVPWVNLGRKRRQRGSSAGKLDVARARAELHAARCAEK